MALDLKHAAIHEAAHAVVLWLIGWGDRLSHIQLKRVPGGAEIARMKADFPPPDSVRAARSTLLVLFAGSAASAEHFVSWMNDIDKDWIQAAGVVRTHFKVDKLEGLLPPMIGFKAPEPNALVQDALGQAKKLVSDAQVKSAICGVAELLLNADPGAEGLCLVSRNDVCLECERILGNDFQRNHPCTDWISGG